MNKTIANSFIIDSEKQINISVNEVGAYIVESLKANKMNRVEARKPDIMIDNTIYIGWPVSNCSTIMRRSSEASPRIEVLINGWWTTGDLMELHLEMDYAEEVECVVDQDPTGAVWYI